MEGDRQRYLVCDLREMMGNFYREIYSRWNNDEIMLELVRRELESMLLAVENNLARIRMSKTEE